MQGAASDVSIERRGSARLACPHCATRLEMEADRVLCPKCARSWEIREGIPQFLAPTAYWGEVPQAEAAALLAAARELGWREAVERRFAADRAMLISILDWQRTSWLPLLGLDADAVALDLGSGYGAITHSLATTIGQVYSLEAIPERIEFTRTRLQQEGITNVHLVQGTALAPPFCERFFDLIVVNGVLEWVGEWETSGNPRSVQVRFLTKLHWLLKDEGVLVIGIENRYGYNQLRGARDHSGISYTSLMPRFLATQRLRHSRQAHHRTSLNPKREYRTYTYSERGYRKLLRESGFGSTRFCWADPGYNLPYYLIPLEGPLVREHSRQRLRYADRVSPVAWRRRAKALLARVGLPAALVPEFAIVAEKGRVPGRGASHRLWNQLRRALPGIPELKEPVFGVATHDFGRKNLVRVFESGEDKPRLILKSSTAGPGSVEAVEREYRNLERVAERLRKLADPVFSVPKPIGSMRVGGFLYTVESVAPGEEFSQILFPRRRDGVGFLGSQFRSSVAAAVQIALMLRRDEEVAAANPRRWSVSAQCESDAGVERLWRSCAAASSPGSSREEQWVQHGDFTIYNLFVEQSSGALSVVDWGELVVGLPPLYDLLSLLTSIVPLVSSEKNVSGSDQDLLDRKFFVAFFGRGAWAEMNRQFLLEACQKLEILRSRVWEMFVQFLVLRCSYYVAMGSREARKYLGFLRLAAQHEAAFLFADHGRGNAS